MRPDAVVSGAVIAVLLAVILFSWWGLQNVDTYEPMVAPIASANAAPLRAPTAPLAASLLFEFDRAVLPPGEAAKLDKLIDTLRAKGLQRLEAVGHADRIGDAAYNLRLSERRADAVKAYLVEKEIDAAMVQTSGRGESEPVSGDACVDMGAEIRRNAALVECLQPDRRVEVRAVGERAR